jgi:ferritin
MTIQYALNIVYMNTNRLSQTITEALNTQMTAEAFASQTYLAYASWAKEKGYDGIANFLFRHAEEERNHMMKILEYILGRGAHVKIEAISAPAGEPASVNNCFEKVFEHEVENTRAIYRLVNMAFEEQDWGTWNFLQWFVKEQIEEESLAHSLLSRIAIAGGENAKDDALYMIDNDLAKTPDEARPAESVTAINP